MTEHEQLFSFQRQRDFRRLVAMPDSLTLESVSEYRLTLALEMLKADFKANVLPASVRTLADVDEYTDANMYLIDDEHPEPKARSFFDWPDLDTHDIFEAVNRLRNRIDACIPGLVEAIKRHDRSGDPMMAVRQICR